MNFTQIMCGYMNVTETKKGKVYKWRNFVTAVKTLVIICLLPNIYYSHFASCKSGSYLPTPHFRNLNSLWGSPCGFSGTVSLRRVPCEYFGLPPRNRHSTDTPCSFMYPPCNGQCGPVKTAVPGISPHPPN